MNGIRNAGCGAIIFYILLLVFCVWGYVANIVKFAKCDFEAPYKSEVLHGIGIFVPPMGVIMGYIDTGK